MTWGRGVNQKRDNQIGDKGGRGVQKSHLCGDVIFERLIIPPLTQPHQSSTWPTSQPTPPPWTTQPPRMRRVGLQPPWMQGSHHYMPRVQVCYISGTSTTMDAGIPPLHAEGAGIFKRGIKIGRVLESGISTGAFFQLNKCSEY